MQWSVVEVNLGILAGAFCVTFVISTISIVLGTVIGCCLGVSSVAPFTVLRVLSRVFVEFFLALPVLVVLVWIYYSIPLFVPGLILSGSTSAVAGLSLSLSAFVAEIMRGGINAIPMGEVEVAYCTGMTRFETTRYILLPQVLRRSWPPLMGQYITTYKFSTLASILAVPELLHTADTIIAQTYRPLEVYTAVALIFVFTVMPLNILLRRVQRVTEWGGTRTM